MRIILNGNINRTYVQTLCMLFFRGEKFPENEENPTKIITVTATDLKNGIECTCELFVDGKKSTAIAFEYLEDFESYERASKTVVGKAVYKAGVSLTSHKTPWGILTGIRPSKIASELLLNLDEQNAKGTLMSRYLLSEDKASLAVTVAKNEAQVLSLNGNEVCSVYISIPFCPSRCNYCSFISYATPKLFELIPKYLEKLKADIISTFKEIKDKGMRVITVYIGGGTPTILNDFQLKELLEVIRGAVDTSSLLEFSLEAGRPDTITESKLKIAKEYGVNRISVNPQTLNDDVLRLIGRRHTANDFFDAYDRVKNSGIGLINTDLIVGLDGDSFEGFKYTLDGILTLNPENITVHAFSVKKSAQILRDNSEIYDKEGEFAVKSMDYANQALISKGYVPYYMYRQKNTICDLENVGYAKPGCFGIYNVLMMSDLHTVYGIGAGATTKIVCNTNGKIEINRIFSPKYPYEYLQNH